VRMTPGGPEAALLEQPNIDKADIERLRERFGLNDPLPVAYAKWLTNAARLDFGRSYQYLRAPTEIIAERIWPTIQLGGLAYGISLVGIPLGVLAALNRGKVPDLAIRFLTVLGDATPHWWMALVIIVVLASTIGWFPNGQGREGPVDWFTHIIIPALILGLGSLVKFVRYTRSQVLEVLGLRNALLPCVTLLGGILPALLSGAAVTEGIFNWPGMGRLFLEAANTRDYPLLLAIITFTTLITLLATLLADVAYGLVDPRIKYS